MMHHTIYDLTRIYESFGARFQPYEKVSSRALRAGDVVLLPPYVVTKEALAEIPVPAVVLLSGRKAADVRSAVPLDLILPMSDHADFEELVHYVQCVKPREIYVTHGDPYFVQYLNSQGHTASFLGNAYTS